MKLVQAKNCEVNLVIDYYWNFIDRIQGRRYTAGWIKEVYPTSKELRGFIERGEMFLLVSDECTQISSISDILGTTALNSACNEGYAGTSWLISCKEDQVYIPHLLTISTDWQLKGFGKQLVALILEKAKADGKRAVRLDILGGNLPAQKLYESMGFVHIEDKLLFYEDTGLTTFPLYEYVIPSQDME